MNAQTVTQTQDSDKAMTRQMWALGDYHAFAVQTVWPLGELLVEACGIRPGHRVLDVATGSGNTAIRAAERGAHVVASDLTPENFSAGRAEAARRGVQLEWREADAEALPFADAAFDVVTSSFGAMFAPDHAAVARELFRVCKPGGVVGMLNFRPAGTGLAFFELLAAYAPAAPQAASPLLWGDETYVEKMLGRMAALDLQRGRYTERSAGGAAGYRDLFYGNFGPVIALRAGLRSQPQRLRDFDRDFLDFATRHNTDSGDAAATYTYEYLLVTARKLK